MNWQYNNAFEVEGITGRYIIMAYLRDNTRLAEKSKWRISEAEEVECFSLIIQNEWHFNGKGFGFKNVTNGFRVLGINPHHEDLKIAKFVDEATFTVFRLELFKIHDACFFNIR